MNNWSIYKHDDIELKEKITSTQVLCTCRCLNEEVKAEAFKEILFNFKLFKFKFKWKWWRQAAGPDTKLRTWGLVLFVYPMFSGIHKSDKSLTIFIVWRTVYELMFGPPSVVNVYDCRIWIDFCRTLAAQLLLGKTTPAVRCHAINTNRCNYMTRLLIGYMPCTHISLSNHQRRFQAGACHSHGNRHFRRKVNSRSLNFSGGNSPEREKIIKQFSWFGHWELGQHLFLLQFKKCSSTQVHCYLRTKIKQTPMY